MASAEVEQRHHHQGRGDECTQAAFETTGRTLLFLDVLLGLLEPGLADCYSVFD
jgi:hypothetical protein